MSDSVATENTLKLNEFIEIRDDAACESTPEIECADATNGTALPEDEPEKINDAIVVGSVSEVALTLPLKLGFGKSRQDKHWPARSMTYQGLIGGLSRHKVGPKDGEAFTQGTAIGNERKVPAIDALYVMGLDVDSGIFPQTVIEKKLVPLGLTAIIYTTHSHLKTETFMGENAYIQFCRKNKIKTDANEFDLATVKRFLLEDRHWEQWIVDTVAVGEVKQTKEGKGVTLRHDAMPKFRAIFPLNEPFVIAKQPMSQLDAIKLWKSKIIGLSKVLELPIDEACLDPSRLFYLPRHDAKRECGIWITGGDALDFDAIPEGKVRGRNGADPDTFEEAGEALAARGGNAYVVNGFSLKRWARECAKDFDISNLIRQRCAEKIRNDKDSEKIEVECPFDWAHSNAGDDTDKGCYVQSAAPHLGVNSFSWGCQHMSCKQGGEDGGPRDRLAYIAEALSKGWFTVADLQSDEFRMGFIERKVTIRSGATFGSVEEAIAEVNEVCATVQIKGKVYFRVCQEKGEELNFLDKTAAQNWFANWRVIYTDEDGNEKNLSAFNVWLQAEERQQYSAVVFRPDGVHNPRHLNTYLGLAIEPKKGDWTLMKRHLFEVWCNSDPDLFEYTLAWFAQLFQEPEELPAVALFVGGKKGTGKSIVKEALRRIFGAMLTSISRSQALTGQFNDFMLRRLLVVGEEFIWGGDPKALGPLKDAISEKVIHVEEKYIPGYDIDNFARFLIFSNEDRALPAEGEDERRFFALKASDARIGDIPYFRALIAEINNGGAEAMLYDLLRFDLSRVEVRKAPKTEALAEQIQANLKTPQKWWFSVLTDGAFLDAGEDERDSDTIAELTDGWEKQPVKLDRKIVQAAYNANVKTYGMVKATTEEIGTFLKTVCPGVDATKKSGSKRFYVFPKLGECREAFEKVAGVRFAREEVKPAVVQDEASATPSNPFAKAGDEVGMSIDHLIEDVLCADDPAADRQTLSMLNKRALACFDAWLAEQADRSVTEAAAKLDAKQKLSAGLCVAEAWALQAGAFWLE